MFNGGIKPFSGGGGGTFVGGGKFQGASPSRNPSKVLSYRLLQQLNIICT